MLLAIFADIHANRQAFAACLDAARARGAERIDLPRRLCRLWRRSRMDGRDRDGPGREAARSPCAATTTTPSAPPSETMNAEAQAAIEWTRGRLSAAQRRFLAELPLTLQDDDRLYVHAEASNPARWRYVQNAADAARSMIATEAQSPSAATSTGRRCIRCPSTAKMTSFVPTADVPVQLLRGPAMARGARLGRAAARRQSGGVASRCSIPRRARSPIAACPTMSRRRRRGSATTACRTGWPIACWSGGERDGQALGPARRRHRRLHHRRVRP